MSGNAFKKVFSSVVESELGSRTRKSFRTVGTSRVGDGPVLAIDFSTGKSSEVRIGNPEYPFFDVFSKTADTVLAAKSAGESGLRAAERLSERLSRSK